MRRLLVLLRRGAAVAAALSLIGVVMFVGLLLVTPSVSNAPALARAIAQAHKAVYPGPAVPWRFAAALTATEDHRFYSEPGVDPIAIARVILARASGGPDQGGATLYQQLAKMLYTHGQTGMLAQAEQFFLGIKLDLAFAKPQILRMYADVAYFGDGYYGLSAASCGYFGMPPASLTWSQAALLAGLVQAPSTDNPLAHFANARARQAHVLGRLVATGHLSAAQARRAYHYPLRLVLSPATHCVPGALVRR